MALYKKILVAIDFSPVAEKVLDRAKRIADELQSGLCLAHAVEYMPPIETSNDMLVSIDWGVTEQEIVNLAEGQFKQLTENHGLADCEQELLLGNPRSEIPRYAEESGCDLIIIGAHSRHGLSGLLGSTADAVLHRAHCDVLAVRTDE